ncbi:hypothetical protein GCM10023340_02390 [Nocardioides marinquilinus]|uniref:Leucine-rich repeat domain-containing protein n=1 Tax=Nocardioides marinquilinus TaxID=1210400 RepID=A0ABP9P5I1_9ACTN
MSDAADPVLSALATRLGDEAAAALLARARGYSNYPNAVKGAAKLDGDPVVEAAALAVVDDPALAGELGLAPDVFPFGAPATALWALLTLAARADVGVVDRVAPHFTGQDYADRLLTAVRRAATRHAAAGGTTSATADTAPAPEVPQKLSQVKPWLAAHPDADPEALAPVPRQKAAARVAAVRTLGSLGTPQALDVLGRYAADRYPDAVLDELHRAWPRFDRRAFAATMFGRSDTLDLGMAPSLEGLGAVPGLTGLDVVLDAPGGADLTPLAECTALRTLRVGAEGEPGLLGVEPLLGLTALTELHLTRTTRHADLTPLARLGVRRLRLDLDGGDGSFLLDMAHLERLLLADGDARPETGEVLVGLVERGVLVTVYRHQAASFPALTERGLAADVVAVEQNGYLGLTTDPDAADGLRRRLASNIVP